MNKLFIAALVAVALLFGAGNAVTSEATDTKSDGLNGASLTVDQGSCPDFKLVVTVTGDLDAPTDVRVEGNKVGQVAPGETGEFSLEGTYELDIVDGGTTVNVNVYEVVDSEEYTLCPPGTGKITIVKDTNPNTFDVVFDFDGDFDFLMEDNNSGNNNDVWTRSLEPGSYEFIESETAGWELVDIDCNGEVGDVDIDLNGPIHLTIDLEAGDDVTCVFINEAVAPTATATPAPTSTPIIVQAPPQIIRVEVTPVPTKAPAQIRPPSTGDAGLAN